MYHVVICDDEVEILNKMSYKISEEFEKVGIKTHYSTFSDSKDLISLIEKEPIDILFLDIDMPYFSGMDIAKIITDKGYKTLLVFVTSHDTLVYQTFAYRPFGFVRKSFFDDEISEIINRLKQELISMKNEIIIKKGSETIRIKIKDICYIESEGNYVNIFTVTGCEHYRDTLSNIENELKNKKFIRCHKGYLINSSHIKKVRNIEIELSNGICIPVGRSYEKDVKRMILELMRVR